MADAYKQYLANKHGSGVGANLTENGTHRIVDGVMNAYAVSGQKIPPNMEMQMQELRDIARSERELAGASAGARNILNMGGTYDPLAVGRRERELVQQLMAGARGVMTEPERVALQQARANARTAGANANIAESNARVTLDTEGNRIELSNQSVTTGRQGIAMNDLQIQAAEQGLSAGELNLRLSEQRIKLGEQTLRQGDLQYETAKLQHELQRISLDSAAAQQTRADAAEKLNETLGEVSTLDIMEVVQADDPALAREMFGEGVTRDVQLEFLTNRLVAENAAMMAGGAATALTGGPEANEATLGLAAIEMQRAERILTDHGEDLGAMINGDLPLPEGVSKAHAVQAFNVLKKRETDKAQLAYDLINDRLDVDGVGPSPAGPDARENKVETAYRVMTTMTPEELGGLQEAIASGEAVTLQIPGMEETLTLQPQQALNAFQLLDRRMTAAAQQEALRATQRSAISTFSDTVGEIEGRVRTANYGVVPQIVQEAIAAERAALADIAFGEGSIDDYTSSVNRIEKAMMNAQMDPETVATIIHGQFQSAEQVANGAVNMISRSADPGLFAPTTNAFLKQLEQRASQERPGLFGSSSNPLTPDRLAEIRQIMINPELSGEESAAQLEEILGYPVQELRGMMQSALMAGNFSHGFGVFISSLTESGAMDTAAAEDLMSGVQSAIRERMEQGQSLSTEDYIQTVQTIAGAFVADPEQQGVIMGQFYEALRSVDGSTLFRRADGSVHQDELALFSFINNMTDPSTPVSGPGSVPIDQLPEVLGSQFEAEIDRAVLGHQRFTNSNLQQKVLSSAVHGLLMGTVTDPQYPLRPIGGFDNRGNPMGTPDQIQAYQEVIALPSQGRTALLQYNPELTRFVTNEIIHSLLATPDREAQWYDFAMPGFLENASETRAHWESIDFEALEAKAKAAGLLKGN